MSTTPSPSGWEIPNSDAKNFSFTSSVDGVTSLSDQALKISATSTPRPIIIPTASTGGIEETRIEFAAKCRGGNAVGVGIVFAYQDINNYLMAEQGFDGNSNSIEGLRVFKNVNSSVTQLDSDFSLGLNPANQWLDVRFQVFRPTSTEIEVRASAAKHGETYQSLGSFTYENSALPFTVGDVGISGGRYSTGLFGVDGDPVGGGRPIKMYWP